MPVYGITVEIEEPEADQPFAVGTVVTASGHVHSEPSTANALARWELDRVPLEGCSDQAPGTNGAAAGEVRCTFVMPDQDVQLRLYAVIPGAHNTGHEDEEVDGDALVSLHSTHGAPPTLEITSPLPDERLYSDHPVRLAATVSDPEDDPSELTVTWTDTVAGASLALDIAEHPDANGSTGRQLLLASGVHVVEVEVTDTDGNLVRDSVSFAVGPPNSSPTCGITPPDDGTTFTPGTSVPLRAWAIDVDLEDHLDLLTYTWSTTSWTASGHATSTGDIVEDVATLSPGVHDIALQVEDELGATCSDVVSITVGSGPTVTITGPPDQTRLPEDETLVFTADVADADELPSTLQLTWTSDRVVAPLGTDAAGDDGRAVLMTNTLPHGTHHVTLTVEDAAGLTASAHVTVDVNAAPGAPVVHLEPQDATSTSALHVVFDTAAVDPDLGDTITYQYAWTRDGVPTSETMSTLLAGQARRGEQWTVSVRATDGMLFGPAATASLVVGNAPPIVSRVVITPEFPHRGDTVRCLASGTSDPDGDPISLTYGWIVDGTTTAIDGDVLPGSYIRRDAVLECIARPSDGQDQGVPLRSPGVTVLDTAPVLASVSLLPGAPTVASVLTCASGEATDLDDDAVTTTVSWEVDGQLLPAMHTTTLSAPAIARDRVVRCRISPNDGTLVGADVWSPPVTVRNTAPVLAAPSLLPAQPRVGDSITCVRNEPTDADEDPVTSLFRWEIDGAIDASVTGPVLPAGFARRGAIVRCGTVPHDGTAAGALAWSVPAVVANTPPSLVSVVLTPGDPRSTTTLEARASGWFDADGDPESVRWVWWIDGVAHDGGDHLDPSWFARGVEVWVEGIPGDGLDEGTSRISGTVVIGNAPPGAPEIAITPSQPGIEDALRCVVTSASVDADADAVSYRITWTVDGAPFAGATETTLPGDTVPAGSIAAGATWRCSVVPNDGLADGPERHAEVTLACVSRPLACDLVDDDCDGVLRDQFADLDQDGDPDCVDDDDDGDGTSDGADCAPLDASIHPGASDIPDDHVDQDCTGHDTVTCYVDQDLDGSGSACGGLVASASRTAEPASSDTADTGDTADISDVGTPSRVAAASSATCVILDPDGACDDQGEAPSPDDCDDTDPLVSPAAVEACNGVDDDCNELVDDGLARPPADLQEGVCVGARQECGGTEGWIEPFYGAIVGYQGDEAACDGVDNDCDGDVDEDLVAPWADEQAGVCSGARKVCGAGAGWVEPDYRDVHPAFQGSEQTCDGLDNDCDSEVDEGLSVPLADNQDGVCLGSRKWCAGGAGWLDPDYRTLPGFESSPEVSCDGRDNDCDTEIDEMKVTWYTDEDGDGWGDAAKPNLLECPVASLSGYSRVTGDCHDRWPWMYPGVAMQRIDQLERDGVYLSTMVGSYDHERQLGVGFTFERMLGWVYPYRGSTAPPPHPDFTWVLVRRSRWVYDWTDLQAIYLTHVDSESPDVHEHDQSFTWGVQNPETFGGWALTSDDGNHTIGWDRFDKTITVGSRTLTNHAMSDGDPAYETSLISGGYARDGNAGWIFPTDPSVCEPGH